MLYYQNNLISTLALCKVMAKHNCKRLVFSSSATVYGNPASVPIYEQISSQIKALIICGDLKAGEALPSIRGLAKSLHISVLTVQKAYDSLQADGFIETTAGKGCFVSAQNQDFYLEEQQKRIEEHFTEAIEIAKVSGIKLDQLQSLLSLLYEED